MSLQDCSGKERFQKRSDAERAVGRRPGRDVYKCDECYGWHVGTSFGPRRKYKRHKRAQGVWRKGA